MRAAPIGRGSACPPVRRIRLKHQQAAGGVEHREILRPSPAQLAHPAERNLPVELKAPAGLLPELPPAISSKKPDFLREERYNIRASVPIGVAQLYVVRIDLERPVPGESERVVPHVFEDVDCAVLDRWIGHHHGIVEPSP